MDLSFVDHSLVNNIILWTSAWLISVDRGLVDRSSVIGCEVRDFGERFPWFHVFVAGRRFVTYQCGPRPLIQIIAHFVGSRVENMRGCRIEGNPKP